MKKTESDKKDQSQVHAYVPKKLKQEFDECGLNFNRWAKNAMVDEVFIQQEIRKKKRSIRLMGSEGVTEPPDQTHPDQEQT